MNKTIIIALSVLFTCNAALAQSPVSPKADVRSPATPIKAQGQRAIAPRDAANAAVAAGQGRGGQQPDVCFKPVTPDQDKGLCHGNWSPIDNTGKFTRHSQTGSDQFTHKSLPINRACQKCPDGGNLHVDYSGLEDHCVIGGSPAQQSATACPSGSTLAQVAGAADYCVRVAVSEPCHGNWMPTDNTGNYNRKTVGGPDSFWHKSDPNRNRTCRKCPNGGTITEDYNGGVADMCVTAGGNLPVVCLAGSSPQVH